MGSTTVVADDTAIGAAVRRALGTAFPLVIPVVVGGVVTLRGVVRSLGERTLAEQAARAVPEVAAVVNELFVGDPGE